MGRRRSFGGGATEVSSGGLMLPGRCPLLAGSTGVVGAVRGAIVISPADVSGSSVHHGVSRTVCNTTRTLKAAP
jgi:hypothetical protein